MNLTVRARLAALHGVLVMLSAAVLLTLIYLLLRANLPASFETVVIEGSTSSLDIQKAGPLAVDTQPLLAATLRQYLLWSAVSLVVLGLISVAAGWWTAGRVLRPLHRITTTARRLSSQNLHERIGLKGPKDELTDLAGTIDEMLARLEAAFASQRRFIANASHELRSPLAVTRAAVQIGLVDPTADELAAVREQLLAENRHSQLLIEGLLLLARSDQGLTHTEPVRLDEVVSDAVAGHHEDHTGLAFVLDLRPTVVHGDPMLLAQLVNNLVTNAVLYNTIDGTVWVRTTADGALEVSNTGEVLASDSVAQLVEPFRRGAGRTHSVTSGSGLGLSIVHSIATAHHGTLDLTARPGGGLHVLLTLPTAPAMPRTALSPVRVRGWRPSR